MLGGAHNFEADRTVAEQMFAAYPDAKATAFTNRALLRRAVEFMVDAGIRQFLDIGSGIPTVGHVHEVAQRAAPESRVVFVDNDAVAVAHSREILRDNDRTAVPTRRAPTRGNPVRPGVATAGSEPAHRGYRRRAVPLHRRCRRPRRHPGQGDGTLASGSYLALSHATDDGTLDMEPFRQISWRSGIEVTIRNRQEVEALFEEFDLVEPGLVWAPQWRPESPEDLYVDTPEMSGVYAAVGRKP